MIAIVATAIGAFALLRPRPRAAAPPSSGETPSAEQAFERARSLAAGERFVESLLLFRSALAGAPGARAETHALFAIALFNASLESDSGGVRHARSSVEQIAWVREAAREYERALAFDLTPAQRSEILLTRAGLTAAWGLPVDALDESRRARAADPGRPGPARLERDLSHALERPTEPEPAAPAAIRTRGPSDAH